MPSAGQKLKKRLASKEMEKSTSLSQEFISEEAQQLWSTFKNRKVEPGRNVNTSSLTNFGIRELFEAVRWTYILKLSHHCYPTLVKMFYCNMNVSGSDNTLKIKTYVKGVHIEFGIEDLGEVLGVATEGPLKYLSPNSEHREFMDEAEVYGAIMSNYKNTHKIQPKELKTTPRILSLIVRHNILPPSTHQVSVLPFQAYLIYCLYSGQQVNLPYIIMRYMETTGQSSYRGILPYGRLIGQILHHFDVECEDEEILPDPCDIDASLLKMMHIQDLPTEDVEGAMSMDSSDEKHEADPPTTDQSLTGSLITRDELLQFQRHVFARFDRLEEQNAETTKQLRAIASHFRPPPDND